MTGWLSPLLSVHLLRPQWLWALLVLPLLWALWRARRRRENVWREAVDPHLLAHLLQRAPGLRSSFFWIGLAWTLAVIAMAGPSWRQAAQPLWQPQAPLVIALDLSQRVTAPDLPPSRLLQARAKIDALLRQRNGGQVALVAYAGEAFTVAPLTDDVGNLALFLDALSPEVMPVEGQRTDRAIAWSVRLLQQGQFERGDILLLTDQADADAYKAAAGAAAQGFRVSVLGLGTPSGAPYRSGDGTIARANLDAASLRALVSAGNGRYVPLAGDDSDLRELGVLEPGQAQAGASPEKTGGTWQDQGYWLLPPLMLLVLLAFRRGALPVLLACALLPLAPSANAADSDWWQRPDQQAHQRLEQGAQAYREGGFAAAEQAFRGVESAEGWYNLGNALAKQGQYDQAIAAYDQALQQRPGMEDAIANRAAVDAARKRQSPADGSSKQPRQQGQEQGQPPDDRKPPPPSGEGDGQKSEPATPSQADQQGRTESGQPSDAAPPEPTDSRPEPEPQDAQTQQAADAAQRERMQQAMEQAKPKTGQRDSEEEPANAGETLQQREQRQAVEAWLRRVPDDPGGLLKMKFRLEYERRLREGQ